MYIQNTSERLKSHLLFTHKNTATFGEGERDSSDDLRLQFEAVSRMPEEERKIVKALLEGMIVKYQTKQMIGGLSS
ncbi:hypothetical protein [Cellvibrio sp. OA-2007]|uniref:hypothetical protein n=1 Tax=Cellvibrio sp. OA-2007 TaxID=529823 RepID=UPI000782F158|nr:hypothetical protein [Cellvibrio sp. OA-2007]